MIVYNKKDGKKKKTRLLLQSYEEVVIKDAHPKIIDEELFKNVQEILNSKKSLVTYDSKYTYILSGLICCSSCGKKLVGSSQTGGRSKTKRYVYQCETHKAGACVTKAINADYLESVVLDYVSSLANKLISKMDLKKSIKSEIQQINPLINKLEKDIKANNRQIETYYSVLANFQDNLNITKETLERLGSAVNTQKKLDAKLTELKVKVTSLMNIKTADVKFTKESLLSNRERARTICKILIEKIIVNEDEDTIELIIK